MKLPGLKWIKELYLGRRLFMGAGVVIALFIFGFGIPWLFPLAQTALAALVLATVADYALLFNPQQQVTGSRTLPRLLSLGDDNPIYLNIHNQTDQQLQLEIVDELPVQLQKRDFKIRLTIAPGEQQQLEYTLHPTARGAYRFGRLHLFASTFIGLVQRRYTVVADAEVPVYPSVLQMKQLELKAFARTSTFEGIKQTRRLGHSYEFEQIKNYVPGDDYRSINWKASGRRGDLMVNQYEDERAQQIYCIIDKSRSMRMPFNGLSLLDYSINSSLALANIALLKHDKAGLLTFSDKMGNLVKADRRRTQLRTLLETLYRQTERNLEANYELLYQAVRHMIGNRSLLVLFTNFESRYAMERALPVLRQLNKRHLLVVVFFENTELTAYVNARATDIEDIYNHTIAGNVIHEKQQMLQELRQYGIQCITTPPENLSVTVINKYLELKSRGLI